MAKTADWVHRTFGYEFRDSELLERALRHRSAPGRSNERLEFLGDAILDAVVSDMLLAHRKDSEEGELSRLRSRLVRDQALAALARDYGLGEYISLGPGEKKSGGVRRDSILADAMEALLGAIFRDGGYEAADAVVRRIYDGRMENLPEGEALKDAKTRLQEWLQARGLTLPVYELVASSGRPHEKIFEVSCRLAQPDVERRASAGSRREAEQAAAARVLAYVTSRSPS